MKWLLRIYEMGLGQVVNNQKSSIFFRSNTSVKTRQEVIQGVGGTICWNYDKYFGLSSLIGRSKYNTFRWIKEKVWLKMFNWKHKFLSQARRELLIKAVLQALPMYSMNVFFFPKNLCKELDEMMAKF